MTWGYVAVTAVSVGSQLYSQNKAKQDAKGAVGAANKSIADQNAQSRYDMAPWRKAGGASMDQLGYLLGLPGYDKYQRVAYGSTPESSFQNGKTWAENEATWNSMEDKKQADWNARSSNPGVGGLGGYGSLSHNFSTADFAKDPGYDFRMQEGQKALERSGAARGLNLSGAMVKGLDRFGQDYASNEYSNAYGRFNNDQSNLFNRLSTMAGNGQQANQYLGTLGMQSAMGQGNNLMGLANFTGAANIGQGNAFGNAITSGYNNWNQNNMWNQWLSAQKKGG